VQNEISRQLLQRIGLANATVTGDTRFDRVLQIKEQAKRLPLVETFVGDAANVFVAGSSWLPDEEIFIKYFNLHKDWKLIIAPHVIGEDHLQQIVSLLNGRKVVRYTAMEQQLDSEALRSADVLIIDCFGLLSSIYHYGTLTYVGGGFGVGIHNVLEAAVWNVPVVIGPNNQKFQEAQELMAAGGCFEISDYASFEQLMTRFSTDADFLQSSGQKAGNYVQGKAGATHSILSDVSPLLQQIKS
jgi:3-deoxy-D-manno-octulosonic-acid transferase